jgi:hypothetical protein
VQGESHFLCRQSSQTGEMPDVETLWRFFSKAIPVFVPFTALAKHSPLFCLVRDTCTKWSACIVHRKANVRSRYGKEAAELFEQAAMAYTQEQFEVIKNKIHHFSNELYQYCFGSSFLKFLFHSNFYYYY